MNTNDYDYMNFLNPYFRKMLVINICFSEKSLKISRAGELLEKVMVIVIVFFCVFIKSKENRKNKYVEQATVKYK